MKVCIVLEGKLKAPEKCGPNIKKYLVDELDEYAELNLVIQESEQNMLQYISLYGNHNKALMYKNPVPDFRSVFNYICKLKNYNPSTWELFYEQFINHKNKSSIESFIKKMYNRHIIYDIFKTELHNYDWFIITSPNMYFINKLLTKKSFENMDTNTLYVNKDDSIIEGINNDLLIFHKNIFNEVCDYIHLFLCGNLFYYYKKNISGNKSSNINLTESQLFKLCMQFKNINIQYLNYRNYIIN
jgi:hypothetical protein